jgi:hypothetical protein
VNTNPAAWCQKIFFVTDVAPKKARLFFSTNNFLQAGVIFDSKAGAYQYRAPFSKDFGLTPGFACK